MRHGRQTDFQQRKIKHSSPETDDSLGQRGKETFQWKAAILFRIQFTRLYNSNSLSLYKLDNFTLNGTFVISAFLLFPSHEKVMRNSLQILSKRSWSCQLAQNSNFLGIFPQDSWWMMTETSFRKLRRCGSRMSFRKYTF